jgi:hypothetical protein
MRLAGDDEQQGRHHSAAENGQGVHAKVDRARVGEEAAGLDLSDQHAGDEFPRSRPRECALMTVLLFAFTIRTDIREDNNCYIARMRRSRITPAV